jgi:hypothetical protein
MTIFHFAVRALVFGLALLLGTTVVAASRFVFNAIANVLRPAAISKRAAFTVEPEPSPLLKPGPFPVLDKVNDPNEEVGQSDFDPTGAYSLNIEKAPKAFADIEFLEIVTREYTEEDGGAYTNRPVVPSGRLQTKKDFSFTKIAIGNREISFETESVDGISYQFVGHFPISRAEVIDCEGCEYPPDLTGILKKVKNGKVVAEITAKFYFVGC